MKQPITGEYVSEGGKQPITGTGDKSTKLGSAYNNAEKGVTKNDGSGGTQADLRQWSQYMMLDENSRYPTKEEYNKISTHYEAPMEGVYEKTNAKRWPLLYSGDLLKYCDLMVRNHSGSNNVMLLQSWWSSMSPGDILPNHTHTYTLPCRTISGIVYEQQDYPSSNKPRINLVMRPLGQQPVVMEPRFGMSIFMEGTTEHWTPRYEGKRVRRCLAFDYAILDQWPCDCHTRKNGICIRCVHYKIDRFNFPVFATTVTEKELYYKQNLFQILEAGLFKPNSEPIVLHSKKDHYRRGWREDEGRKKDLTAKTGVFPS